MDTTRTTKPTQPTSIRLPPEPEPPADWECCGSECGDACIFELYRQEKAQYDAAVKALRAQQKQAENPCPSMND